MRSPARRSTRLIVVATAIAAVTGALLAAGPARADVLDFQLERLVPKPVPGVGNCPANAPPGTCFADPTTLDVQQDYRQLVSELGTALAPKILTTADTVGYSGFQFTVDSSFTSISTKKCDTTPMGGQHCPYRGVQGVDGTAMNGLPSYATTVSLYARKGIWLPLPSFELGAGVTKMLQSEIFAVQVYGKLALHEGFHDWPLPSIAIRGSGMRVMGAQQVDMTMGQLDFTLSKHFGIAGTVTFSPYLGAAVLFIIHRGQVIDTTPEIDSFKQGPNSLDLNANGVFPDQDTIIRARFFGGFRLVYSIIVITADYMYTACGDFGSAGVAKCGFERSDKKIPDLSDHQHTFNVSGGFLF